MLLCSCIESVGGRDWGSTVLFVVQSSPVMGEMNHTKRRLSTGAGSISQDEARNPSPGNLGLVATISVVGCPIQHEYGRATVDCWMSLGPCAWGDLGGGSWASGLCVEESRAQSHSVSNGRRPAKLRILPLVSHPTALDSRLDRTRLGSTRLETFRPQTRRAPLVFCLVAKQSLTPRCRRPDFDMSSFIFPRYCSDKKERNKQDKQEIPPPAGLSLLQPSRGKPKAPTGPRTRVALKLPIWGGNSSPATGASHPRHLPSTPFLFSFCDSRNPDYSKRRIRCHSFFPFSSWWHRVAPTVRRSDSVSLRQ